MSIEQSFHNRRPSGFNPTGRIIRKGTAKIADDDNGIELSVSAPSIVVRIIANRPSRRSFRQHCERYGVLLVPLASTCETDRTFNKNTGERRKESDIWDTDTFQAYGAPESLATLLNHASLAEWHYVISARVPVSSGGSGEMTQRATQAVRFASMPKAEKQTIETLERSKTERLAAELPGTMRI